MNEQNPGPGAARFDEMTYEGVVARYTGPLRRFFTRKLRDFAEAENMVQETFVRIFRYAESYSHGHRFSAWIYAIAGNLWRDMVRRESRLPGMVELSEAEPAARDQSGNPEAAAMDRELETTLLLVLTEIPGRHRAVFVLKHHYGMTYAEVGQILKISEGTVKSRMHKATRLVARKMALRGYLKHPGGGAP